MGKYKVEKYNKRTKFYKEEIVNLSTSLLFWINCQMQSAKDNIKVKYISKPTRNDLNRKVVFASVEFPDGECWVYTLIKK